MYPGCLTTVALIMTGSTSVGGLTAFAIDKLYRRDQETIKEGDVHEGTQDWNT